MDPLTAAALETNWAMFGLGNETLKTPLATLIRNESLPDIYDANMVGAIRASTPAEIENLFDLADSCYAHTGHRRFIVDQRTPLGFAGRLALHGGYTRDETLIMVLEGDLRGLDARASDIRPIDREHGWEAFWELMWLDWQEGHQKQGRIVREDVARQMWEARKGQQPPMQYWLAHIDQRPVGYLASWGGVNGVGQIENLFTHPDFRLRGIAKSLLFHCVARSRAAGAGPVVIAANPTDTPKDIYASLGFHPVAVVSQYLKRLDD